VTILRYERVKHRYEVKTSSHVGPLGYNVMFRKVGMFRKLEMPHEHTPLYANAITWPFFFSLFFFLRVKVHSLGVFHGLQSLHFLKAFRSRVKKLQVF